MEKLSESKYRGEALHTLEFYTTLIAVMLFDSKVI